MIETIESTFSNRVLVIDEVHNIRTEEGDIKSRDTIKYIELVIKYSKFEISIINRKSNV